MALAFWEQVVADGGRVPRGHPLADLTAELTAMLGHPDPHARDHVACWTLRQWVSTGVYDDLLHGLGDGMTEGLRTGLDGDENDSVFRRGCSALVLAACIERDTRCRLLPGHVVLGWGDRAASWLLAERDLRGLVPGRGWAHAVARAADVLGALGESPHLAGPELWVLLDVLAQRLLATDDRRFLHGEDDRMALATMRILRRDLLDSDQLQPWLDRLAQNAAPTITEEDTRSPTASPSWAAANVQAYLRALHTQLALAQRPPRVRADLLLALLEALRNSNREYVDTG